MPKEKTAEQRRAEEEAARRPTPHVHWFSVTFGEQAALNASCGKAPRYRCHLGCILLKMSAISLRAGKGPDGSMRGQGWLQLDGKTQW